MNITSPSLFAGLTYNAEGRVDGSAKKHLREKAERIAGSSQGARYHSRKEEAEQTTPGERAEEAFEPDRPSSPSAEFLPYTDADGTTPEAGTFHTYIENRIQENAYAAPPPTASPDDSEAIQRSETQHRAFAAYRNAQNHREIVAVPKGVRTNHRA